MSDALIWIPARGGSVRIPGKNLEYAGGCSLLARTVWAAREFRRLGGLVARIIVDTDSEDIAAEGRAWGAEVPFLREARYATSEASSADAALRILARLQERGDPVPHSLVLLQPTSPLREMDHLLDCWRRFSAGGAERVVSVRPADVEYEAALTATVDGMLSRAGGKGPSGVLCPSGAFYAVTVEALRRDRSFHLDGGSRGVVTNGLSALDVDEVYELELTRGFLERPPAERSGCFIIAEAGVNHCGDLGRALEMVDAAADAGADVVKFQTFDPSKLVEASASKAAYQIENTGDAGTQHDMLATLALSEQAHVSLQTRCRERGVRFMSSPFDEEGAEFLVRLGADVLKVPSGEITNWPFLEHLAGLRRPLIVSTGMSSLTEVADAVEVIRRVGEVELTLLHCVSDYPTRPEDANLRAMWTLGALFQVPVGWSDHTQGIAVSVAAAAMGAAVIEKHFTLDRTLPGPDHRASLEPDELRVLVDSVRDVEVALGTGEKVPIEAEMEVAKVARRSLHTTRDLERGHVLAAMDVARLRPGTGIPPSRIADVLGRRLTVGLPAGALIEDDALG